MKNSYNWKKRREKTAFLALEDGSVFYGYSVSAEKDIKGEVVFNTGMTGYQEILTDPSYAGQIVTMTYPEIGNTGLNLEDMESHNFFLNGFIIHEYTYSSNWRSRFELDKYLKKYNVPCIAGIDTRSLTELLRKKGTLKGYLHCSNSKITCSEAVKRADEWPGLDDQDYAKVVTCKKPWHWTDEKHKTTQWPFEEKTTDTEYEIAAYDFGIKWNILKSLRNNGMNVTVFPADTPPEMLLKYKPDGVVFSNGPGDPAGVKYAVEAAKSLIGKVPVMGICLGHQILSLACGAKSIRLKFGHHGCNHPVRDIRTGKVEITSQNHNFAVDRDSLRTTNMEITHINLNDNTVEGIMHEKEPVFAVQYHPEASPGPHDPSYLFNRFKLLIKDS
ncbi:MAG: glutamine-hydrolyzing carbamoyl-phosphate synthase small subunit [Victivallales bacterium]|nr:glutamine-hydrolyzing carbamoyl-phosphate synthase small subunit [Victivallales bacterium]